MFAFTNMMNFLAHKFAGLRAGRFAFTLILLRAFQSFFFGHRFPTLVSVMPRSKSGHCLCVPPNPVFAKACYALVMSFTSIRLITFDCYGTLIDWESGMLAALRPLLSREGRKVSDVQILELYGEIEAELEGGTYLPYR